MLTPVPATLPDSTPIWLANISVSLSQSAVNCDWDQYFYDLNWLAPRANRWLDETRVKGSIEAHEIAKIIYRHLITHLADFTLLTRPGLLRDTAVRFRNVLEAAC